jgi:hypothetical protein
LSSTVTDTVSWTLAASKTYAVQSKRLFIKDIIHYLVPPEGKQATIAPSLSTKTIKKGVGTNRESIILTNGSANGITSRITNGITNGTTNRGHKAPYPYNTAAETGNPTVIPTEMLKRFHFTFLIRHPRHSIPSYWRCTVPPLDEVTGFYDFMPSEAGYDELRRVFDFLREKKQIGPSVAGKHGELKDGEVSITVVDADDLLDDPENIIETYCKEVGIAYCQEMLSWDTEEDHQRAKDAFEKWKGFHDDAINSTSLKPRCTAHVSPTTLPYFSLQEWLASIWNLTDLCIFGRRMKPRPLKWKTKNGVRSMERRARKSSENVSMPTFRTTNI